MPALTYLKLICAKLVFPPIMDTGQKKVVANGLKILNQKEFPLLLK
jgi:hypothetical protein